MSRQELGTFVHNLRINRQWSLADVAKRTGYSRSHIWKVEKGAEDNPGLRMLEALADCYEVPISNFFGERNIPPSSEEKIFARKFIMLSPREKRIVATLIKGLLIKSEGDA